MGGSCFRDIFPESTQSNKQNKCNSRGNRQNQNFKKKKKKEIFETLPLSCGWCRLVTSLNGGSPGSLDGGRQPSLHLVISSCLRIQQHFSSFALRRAVTAGWAQEEARPAHALGSELAAISFGARASGRWPFLFLSIQREGSGVPDLCVGHKGTQRRWGLAAGEEVSSECHYIIFCSTVSYQSSAE